MKKLLSCLLIVVLLVSLVVSLIACDSDELKNLSYVDENGNVVTVKKIKKTDDAEAVATAVMALAAKEENVAAVSQLLVSLNASLSLSGTQGETAFENNVSASAKLGVSGPVSKEIALSEYLKATKAYASINVSGKLPDVNIDQIVGDENIDYTDFTKVTEFNESAEIFVDNLDVYTKANLSESVIAEIAKEGIDLTEVNGKLGVMKLSTKLSAALVLFDSKVDLNKILTENNSWAKAAESIMASDEDEDDDEEATEETTDEPSYTDFETLVNVVKIFHIRIVKTKGSVVTFSAEFNADSVALIKELYGEDAAPENFEGTVSATLELDAKTMLDFTLTVSIGDVVKSLLNEKAPEGTTFTSVSASATVSVSTQTAIPTLSQEEKDNAVTIDTAALVKKITKLFK